MHRRRLLIVSTEFPPGPGGIGTHAYQIASKATEADWDVTVLAAQEYVPVDDAEAFNAEQPFSVVRFDTEGSFVRSGSSRVRAASRLADYFDPDLTVASGSWAVTLSASAPGLRKRPLVCVAHDTEFGGVIGGNSPMVLRHAYGRAAAVVCVSAYTRRRLDEVGIRARNVVVITNGGDSRVFKPRDDAKEVLFSGQFRDAPLLLTVGNVGLRKAQDVVIDALPALVDQGVDVQYLAVGLPTDAEQLIARAAQLGVSDRVHLVGYLDLTDLTLAYQACDVFAMTSREAGNGSFEGYGIAVVEAALCGKPAVVTADSGLEEAVADGETGVVVPQNDPAAFATAAGLLLTDEPRRNRLGAAARDHALKHGTWDLRCGEYLTLFDSVVGDRTSGRGRRAVARR